MAKLFPECGIKGGSTGFFRTSTGGLTTKVKPHELLKVLHVPVDICLEDFISRNPTLVKEHENWWGSSGRYP